MIRISISQIQSEDLYPLMCGIAVHLLANLWNFLEKCNVADAVQAYFAQVPVKIGYKGRDLFVKTFVSISVIFLFVFAHPYSGLKGRLTSCNHSH